MSKVAVGIVSKVNKNNQKEYLLVSAKRDFGEFTGFYYPPGGHIEEGENKNQALRREIEEELGIEIEPVKEIAETPGDVEGQITYWWLCNFKGGDLKIDKEEIADANFFTEDKIRQLKLWPATKQFFERYIFITT